MIIDTSALVAILDQEPEAERIARVLAATTERQLSAANLVEVGIVVQARHGNDGARDLDLLLAKLKVEIVPLTERQAEIAQGVSPLWPPTTCRATEFWRLLCLRPGEGCFGPVVVQGR
jgi:uncharacterized protein with PIN domain